MGLELMVPDFAGSRLADAGARAGLMVLILFASVALLWGLPDPWRVRDHPVTPAALPAAAPGLMAALGAVAGTRLSPRETEVARLLLKGFASAEIAAHLFISEPTVRTHLRRIYAKTGTGSGRERLGLLLERLAGR